jgi:quercetin dioxygenase-like cupin family protein
MRFRFGPDSAADRRELVISGGDVLHLPSNLPHEATALERSIVLDVFSPPSATTGIDRR